MAQVTPTSALRQIFDDLHLAGRWINQASAPGQVKARVACTTAHSGYNQAILPSGPI
jgi:hypothetical protein